MFELPESPSSLANSSKSPTIPHRTLVKAEPEISLSTRGRMGVVPGVRIVATGSYAPERIVTNDDLAALGCDSQWIIRRTGIRQRRHAAVDETTSDLAYQAAIRCIANANSRQRARSN